ncbi:hypothetical protein ACWGJ9_11660 [Curtobacterium citreum]
MNDTAEYKSVLQSASELAALKVRRRDVVRQNDDAAHDLHEVRARLTRWANMQAVTPFLTAGTVFAAVIFGLILSGALPSGTFNAGGFILATFGAPTLVGALVFSVASAAVRDLRQQASQARSRVNLSERDLLEAGEDVAAAEAGYWARKRPAAPVAA